MLSWPPGPRDTDGVWAQHWYAGVEASTGFAPYSPGSDDPLPDHLAAAAGAVPARTTRRWPPTGCGRRRTDAAELRRPQPRPDRQRSTASCVHRDEAGVSPFDSVVQGGDAVWEGLRLYGGRIFRLDEHLARLRRSAMALALHRDPQRTTRSPRGSGDAGRQRDADDVHIRLTLTRGVKITSGMDPRLNQAGPDPDRAGGVQVAGLRRSRDPADHRRRSAGIRPDSLDPKIHHNNLLTSILAKIEANVAGADDALMLDDAGLHRRDQRHPRVPRRRRRGAHPDHPGLPGGHHPGRGHRAVRRARPRLRGRRPLD